MQKQNSEIDISVLEEILDCDPEAGVLTWRPRQKSYGSNGHHWKRFNAVFAGKRAGYLTGYGYVNLSILGQKYTAHRVVYAMATGHWPKGEIDHINGDPTDNRIANLRDVAASENMKNRPRQCNNSSGVQGVRKKTHSHKWIAFIYDGGKQIHLGTFDAKQDAIDARCRAELRYGFHPNHGRAA